MGHLCPQGESNPRRELEGLASLPLEDGDVGVEFRMASTDATIVRVPPAQDGFCATRALVLLTGIEPVFLR